MTRRMDTNPLPHQMILASAGSGKTHALVNRYIRILLLTGQPERIIALTFTRTAAGEFFEGVAQRLHKAASNRAEAEKLSREIEVETGTADYLSALKHFLANSHRLRLLTLDAFFAQIVQCFPLELGLGGVPRILEPVAIARAYRVTLDRLAHPGRVPAALLHDFWNAFKEATMGVEVKRVDSLIADYVGEHHELLLEAPAEALWGDADTIWPQGCPWLDPHLDPGLALAQARSEVDAAGFGKAVTRALEDFLAQVEQTLIRAQRPDSLKTLPARLLDHHAELVQGLEVVVPFGRSKDGMRLAGEFGRNLGRLAGLLMLTEIGDRLKATRGVYRVVREFERNYHDEVRGMGKLGFSDLTRILLQAPEHSRALLDYRMDGVCDHWLFDEFQDTSRPQWDVVANLVDEVVQGPPGERSLFYVGDTKQSLYLWRDSDEQLFFRIRDRYDGLIEQLSLNRSWRSAPPVIEMVNRTFDDNAAIAECFGPGAAGRWQSGWELHESAPPRQAERAHAALLVATPGSCGRDQITLDLLQQIQPLQRGLSVAILVRKNAEATALAEFLRNAGGLRVVTGSSITPLTDNLPAVTLLALFRMTAHPADDQAAGMVWLSPLPAALQAMGVVPHQDQQTAMASIRRRILEQVGRQGIEAAARHWGDIISRVMAGDDAFSKQRLESFYEVARLFEASEPGGMDDFLDFAIEWATRDTVDTRAIRVMTIHAAKGLGFDLVILPELQDRQTLRQARQGISVRRDADGRINWVLQMPKKEFAAKDQILRRHLDQAEDQAAFESLCNLYVAMTRAKRGLYMITDPLPGPEKCNATYPALLGQIFGHTGAQEIQIGEAAFSAQWELGDRQWFAADSVAVEKAPPTARQPSTESAKRAQPWHRQPRFVSRRPSAAQDFRIQASVVFTGGTVKAAFGEVVHALFERIDQLPQDREQAVCHVRDLAKGVPDDAVNAVVQCLANTAILDVFADCSPQDTLWRERAFAVVLDGKLVNGVFDRVRVRPDKAGKPAVDLWDFKTDRLEGGKDRDYAVAVHAPQLSIYRLALAKLLHVPTDAVRCHLVFTDIAEVVTVDKSLLKDAMRNE